MLFDRCLAKTDAGCVVIDNEAGSHALVRHLAARGFRKIAIITTFPHLPTMELRHRGYLRALAEAGLHADPRLYEMCIRDSPNGILVCDDPAAEELRVATYRYFKDIERENLISK